MDQLRWDAICVGAGITSLAFGAQLVQRYPGVRLLIIDKHSVPGGYATMFRRPKVNAVFDCSLHKLSGMGQHGNLYRILCDLGLDNELELHRSSDYFEANFPSRSFKLSNDIEGFQADLYREFPHEKIALEQFFSELAIHGRNGYYQFQMMDGSYEADFSQLRYAHRHLKHISVEQALNERFRDKDLCKLIAATGIYVGGFANDLGYLYFLHVLYATLTQGNAYVKGSSQRLSDLLVSKIERAGGKVLLNTNVHKVLSNTQDQVRGVLTSKGEFHAPRVYINASPHYALNVLFDEHPDLPQVRSKLQKLAPSRSTTTLYLTTDQAPESLGFESAESMLFTADEEWEPVSQSDDSTEMLAEQTYWRDSTLEVTNYHLLDAHGGPILCANVLDDIAHWPDRKSPLYKLKKARAQDALLQRLYAAKPDLQGHVNYLEVSTPRTYERFTNNTDGAGYGAMVGTDLSGHVFHHGFPIAGVQFLSAWVAGPSYEAAFGYAEMKVNQWAA
ncbi:MAG: NAD(P)/FAD-dependent oxidoreductase [Burkholderiaceae bacterium]|nr:MAG: NAD(P)/FAD-dependent oxidoreductase [Burkholderiaceae bacterium]